MLFLRMASDIKDRDVYELEELVNCYSAGFPCQPPLAYLELNIFEIFLSKL